MTTVAIHTEGIGKEYRRGSVATSGLLRDVLAKSLRSPATLFQSGRLEKFWALKNISLEANQGEVIGLIGRNGSGKTTLLKILSRITRPTTGYAEIRGRVGSLLEVGTGFHPELTGRENAYFSGAILGMRKAEIDRKFDEIVSFAEIERFIDTPVKHYSTGMSVRLAFAVAAHIEPEILLVDEVLAVGDIKFQQKCLGKMDGVARAGRTIVLVSHQLNQIRRLCRLAVWLDSGQVRQVGPVAEVVTAYEAEMTLGSASLSRPAQGRAQFLSWNLEDGNGNSDHALGSDGPVTASFLVRVNEDLDGVHLGIQLYDQSGYILWSQAIEGFCLGRGLHEIRYTLSSLPLRPGAYSWRIGLWDSTIRVDEWECLPPMQVVTTPLARTRDEFAGVLNIACEFDVKPMESEAPVPLGSSADRDRA